MRADDEKGGKYRGHIWVKLQTRIITLLPNKIPWSYKVLNTLNTTQWMLQKWATAPGIHALFAPMETSLHAVAGQGRLSLSTKSILANSHQMNTRFTTIRTVSVGWLSWLCAVWPDLPSLIMCQLFQSGVESDRKITIFTHIVVSWLLTLQLFCIYVK